MLTEKSPVELRVPVTAAPVEAIVSTVAAVPVPMTAPLNFRSSTYTNAFVFELVIFKSVVPEWVIVAEFADNVIPPVRVAPASVVAPVTSVFLPQPCYCCRSHRELIRVDRKSPVEPRVPVTLTPQLPL